LRLLAREDPPQRHTALREHLADASACAILERTMRPLALLMFLSIASADVDPAVVASGEWSFRVFLQLDTGGYGAWGDAKAGAMARFETVSTGGGVLPDLTGPKPKKVKKPEVSQQEIRVVKRDDGQLVLQTRGCACNERGQPGKWGKAQVSELRTVGTADWKVERLGEATRGIGSRSVVATTYRVRIPEGGATPAEESWIVVGGGDVGVIEARQESGTQIEWKLARTDVELKVGSRKVLCREYEFRWKPTAELEDIAVKERRMFLCAEVPGRVVRQTYSGFLGKRVEANLISVQGR
jgi:hypothetical protein